MHLIRLLKEEFDALTDEAQQLRNCMIFAYLVGCSVGDDSYPNGFYLRHLNDGLWLRGYRATPDHLWPCDAAFVFQLSSP